MIVFPKIAFLAELIAADVSSNAKGLDPNGVLRACKNLPTILSIIGVITASKDAVISVFSTPANSFISGQLAAAIWAANFPSIRLFLLIVSLISEDYFSL